MPHMNLATIFSQSFIRPENEDPALLMGTSANRSQVTFVLISQCSHIFQMEYTETGQTVVVGDLLDLGGTNMANNFDPQTDSEFGSSKPEVGGGGADLLELAFIPCETGDSLPVPILPTDGGDKVTNGDVEEMDIPDKAAAKMEDSQGKQGSPSQKPQMPKQRPNITDQRPPVPKERPGTSDERPQMPAQRPVTRPQVPPVRPLAAVDPSECEGHQSDENQITGDVRRRRKETQSSQNELVVPADPDGSAEEQTPVMRSRSSLSTRKRTLIIDGSLYGSNTAPENSQELGKRMHSLELDKRMSAPQGIDFDARSSDAKTKPVDKSENLSDNAFHRSTPSLHTVKPAPPHRLSRNVRRSASMGANIIVPDEKSQNGASTPSVPPRPKKVSLTSASSETSIDTCGSNDSLADDPDDKTVDALIATDLANFTQQDLLTHIDSLCTELKHQRSKVKEGKCKLKEQKDRHRQQIHRMAEKLDNERTATAEAVERVVRLQAELQSFHMRYGAMQQQ